MVANIQFGKHVLPDGSELYVPYDKAFDFSGVDPAPPEIDPYTIDTVQKFPLGTCLDRYDDRYRYVEFGGTTAAGDVIQAEAPDPNHDDLDPTGTGTDYGTPGVAAGDTIISIASSITLVANEYAGGSLAIETDTGKGYRYRVLRNTAASAAANSSVEIQDGLAVAIDSTSNVKLVKSRYKEVIQMPTTLTGVIVGVGLGVGADGSFGWVQTRGVAAVLTNGTVVIGQPVTAGATTAGSVDAYNEDGTANLPIVGWVVDVGPTTQYSLIALQGIE